MNKQPQSGETKPKESKLLFLEKAVWKTGREIITVLLVDEHGRKHNIAHIYLEYGDEPKRKAFMLCDAKGMEMLPPSAKLHDLKKQLIALEPHLEKMLKERLLSETRRKSDRSDNEISR